MVIPDQKSCNTKIPLPLSLLLLLRYLLVLLLGSCNALLYNMVHIMVIQVSEPTAFFSAYVLAHKHPRIFMKTLTDRQRETEERQTKRRT